ncbi:Flagellar M-ring protein [Planctomycetes bacterium Pla163]|uniref:Flagellar M-ring protein n=1 Tax=Rohdeia mirabilis TaxID=2528008 RepID=A0A518D4U6_9BACT|nr:Flagellar M-ring protein [Planctomycetes bacterium Pla163]
MKNALATIWEQISSMSAAARATVLTVVLGVAVAAGVAVHFASQPHYVMLVSGLDDTTAARVGEALAGANVEWRSSQPPGPFVIYVDESQKTMALNAVASAGAMKPMSGGILTDPGGLSSLLLGSQEREQIMRKRIWEEMQRMLELLDFVVAAKVQTLVPEARVFGRQPALTASVTLVTDGGLDLTREQARTVARLVRFGLGIEEQNLVIADDSGKSIYDGNDLSGRDGADDWLAAGESSDRRLEAKAVSILEDILGPGLARVAVRSEWDFSTSRTLADTAGPEAAQLVSERSTTTTDPRFSNDLGVGGGVAGSSGNLNNPSEGFGTNSQGVVDARSPQNVASSSEPAIAKTSQQDKRYVPSRTLRATEQRTPKLERLSIALYLDASLDANSVAAIQETVKATVGFSQERGDLFQIAQIPFLKSDGADGVEGSSEAPAKLDPLMELLIDRGVEIVLAVVFMFLILKSARGASKSRKQRERELAAIREREAAEREAEAEQRKQDAELEAQRLRDLEEDPIHQSRRRVSDLVGEEPDKVADLLTAWVRDERGVGVK